MTTAELTFEMLSQCSPALLDPLLRHGELPDSGAIQGKAFLGHELTRRSAQRRHEAVEPTCSFIAGGSMGAGIYPLSHPVTGETIECALVCAVGDDPKVLLAKSVTKDSDNYYVLQGANAAPSELPEIHAQPEKPLNIMVAGAAGFIFSQVAKLGAVPGYGGVRGEHQIVAVDQRLPDYDVPNMIVVRGDLSSRDGVQAIFDEAEAKLAAAGREPFLHGVANGAALFSYTRPQDELFMANTLTARHLARECGKRGAFLVHMGATASQDNLPPPLKESDFPAPIEPYGFSKALADLEVWNAVQSHGLRAVILRATAVVGPGLGQSRQYIKAMFEQLRTPVVPLPKSRSSYVSSIDVARAALFAIENPRLVFGEPREMTDIVYNICDTRPVADADVFRHLMQYVPRKFRIASRWFAPGPRAIYVAGAVAESVARVQTWLKGVHQEPKVARNLARLLKADKVQDRAKFARVFEGNGFSMTYPSTFESLDAVMLDYYQNTWHEAPPATLTDGKSHHTRERGLRLTSGDEEGAQA